MTPPQGREPSKLRFHQIKSSAFRVAFADGVMGGITPAGNLHLAFFNERPAIPKIIEQSVDEFGQLQGDSEIVEGISGVVREIEIDLVMPREAVEQLIEFLNDKISEFSDYDQAVLKAKSRKNS